MQKDLIVFDIDGTLSIVGDRKECLKQTPKNWNEFYARCFEDKPNKPIMDMCRLLMAYIPGAVIFVTGRRESCRAATQNWFVNHGLYVPNHTLYMRPDNDFRHDTLIKPEIIKHLFPRIKLIFEDRASMVQKWRELDFTCVQVADGNF